MAGRTGQMLLPFLLAFCLCSQSDAQLRLGFYRKSCPRVQYLVRSEVRKAVTSDSGLAAGLVRLHFHDAFVRGADGSVLIDSTANNTAEKDSPVNNPSLRGYEVIDKAKKRLEAECKGIVSCADILAFAARDGVFFTMGLPYSVPAGRRDGRVSLASETLTNLVPPTANLSQLTQGFATKGLTQDEMITLSGAHTIGRSHCIAFSNRLYNFNSTVSQDPTLDTKYAATLKKKCPNTSSGGNLTVPMDPITSNIFDTNYYKLILANRGLFTSDQSLMSTSATAAKVRQNAQQTALFKSKFSAAMVKMGKIGVLTGNQGEIRANCRKIN